MERLKPAEVHMFGIHGEKHKTLYSTRIFLPIDYEAITVRANVIQGDHPFLIGLATLERMGAYHDFSERTLSFKLEKKQVKVKLETPGKHQIIPLFKETSSFSTIVYRYEQTENDLNLKKLHENTGHANLSDIRTLLQHAGRWKQEYAEAIESIIIDCPSRKACRPKPAPVTDISHISPIFNQEAELDITCFHGRPLLHTEYKKTKFSSAAPLQSRHLTHIWNAFVSSWIFSGAHGPPQLLQGDEEFEKEFFKTKCAEWSISFCATAAKAKWQQGIVK